MFACLVITIFFWGRVGVVTTSACSETSACSGAGVQGLVLVGKGSQGLKLAVYRMAYRSLVYGLVGLYS